MAPENQEVQDSVPIADGPSGLLDHEVVTSVCDMDPGSRRQEPSDWVL